MKCHNNAIQILLITVMEVSGWRPANDYRFQKPRAWRSSLRGASSFSCVMNCARIPNVPEPSPFAVQWQYIDCNTQKFQLTSQCLKKAKGLSMVQLGKSRYFAATNTNQKENWHGAGKFCRSRGLMLGTLELEDAAAPDKEIVQFLTRSFSTVPKPGVKNTTPSINLWSRATNLKRPGGPFYWDETYNEVKGYKNNSKKRECLSITIGSLDTVQWKAEDCRSEKPFFCITPLTCNAVKCLDGVYNDTGPWCPPVNCTTDISMFSLKDKELDVPASFGYLKRGCGNNYVFSSQKGTFSAAREACCRLGMELLSMDSRDEQTCLSNLFKLSFTGSRMFWTSASDEGVEKDSTGDIGWCSSGNLVENMRWRRGESNAERRRRDKRCVAIDMSVENALQGELIFANCHQVLSYICKGSDSYRERSGLTGQLFLSHVPCQNPECPTVPCQSDPNLLAKNGAAIPKTYTGLFKKACKKNYYFSNDKKNVTDATISCCKINMTLLSLESQEELDCLAVAYKENLKVENKYWTSGSDHNCPWKFTWCSTGFAFPVDIVWAGSQPDSKLGEENCVFVTLSTEVGKAALEDDQCATERTFICESKS